MWLPLSTIPEFVSSVKAKVYQEEVQALDISKRDASKLLGFVGKIAAKYYKDVYGTQLNTSEDEIPYKDRYNAASASIYSATSEGMLSAEEFLRALAA
jgi:hypothetical protein